MSETVQAAAEPIVKGPGDASSVSFDELESVGVSTQDKFEADDGISNKTEKPAKEAKESKEDDDTSPVEEKPLEKIAKEAKEKKLEAEKAQADKIKTVKFKVGDKEDALPMDASVEVSVRGKKEFVKISDLTAEFSGKTDWNRKYSDLNKDKQEFTKQQTVLQGYVNELYDTMIEKKDAEGAIMLLAEAMGGNPIQVVTEFKKQLMGQVEAWSQLTPEERKVKELEEQLALRQRQEDSLTKARATQKESSEVESRTLSVIEKYGMDREKFVSYYQELKGKIPDDKLTPERIGEYHQTLERWDALSSTLDEVGADLGEKKDGAVEELLDLWAKQPDFTVSDIKEIAAEVYGSQRSKNLARKLKKSTPTQTAKPAKTDDPISWDEID